MKGSVLIVDDDRSFRILTETALAGEGFEVRSAATLRKAREELDSGAPDVVVLDRRMPDGDGIALLQDGRPDEAIEQLDKAGRLPAEDSADQAIRDKSNLVLGTILFESAKAERAKQSLDRVRLEVAGGARVGDDRRERAAPLLALHDPPEPFEEDAAHAAIAREAHEGARDRLLLDRGRAHVGGEHPRLGGRDLRRAPRRRARRP